MTNQQKQSNQQFFQMMLMMTKEGGQYIWSDINESFTVKGGKFYGTSRGVKKMKDITPQSFHNNIKVK